MIDVKPHPRHFLPQDFKITSWDDLKLYAQDLEQRPLNTMADFQKFLDDYTEFDRVTADEYWWRYVNLSRYTADEKLQTSFNDFTAHITPELTAWGDRINQKITSSPFAKQMDEPGFEIALRRMQSKMDVFSEKNLKLKSREEELIAEYGKVTGAMTVELDGKEISMPEASNRLYWIDRDKREEAWRAIAERQYLRHEVVDKIFDEMVRIRHQIALNAGFENYRDYMFRYYNRYDYTPQDCHDFYNSSKEFVVPIIEKIHTRKAKAFGLEKLRPWDTAADAEKREPLKSSKNIDDLIEKSLQVAGNIDPVFRDTLQAMKDHGNLDLEARKNKRAGGYNQEFLESNVSFVFGNFTGQIQDIITMVHELGHAVHNNLCTNLRLNSYRMPAIETAELASMSMELISLDQWHIFFPNPEDLIRAKRTQLERSISVLQTVMPVDAFQHEIYVHPEMSQCQRYETWEKVSVPITSRVIDWSGLEKYREMGWQIRHHPFDLPFYYIEYAMAQLGALQVWRNYKKDPAKTLEQYKYALSLGSTKTIPEIYEAAGVKFDFSADTIKELMTFVEQELDALGK